MKDNNYKWFVVGMLWLICFFNYADRQGIFSVFPLLKDKAGLGLSDIQLGVVASAFMWVYAGVGWLAGIVGDRFNRKAVILSGFGFWSLITLALGFSTQYWHLVFFRAVEGLGEAFYFPAAMSMISDYHGKETRSRAMGIHQSSVYAGTVAGGTLAAKMGQHYGWRSSFYLLGIGGLVLSIILIRFLKEPPRRTGGSDTPANPGECRTESLLDIFKGMVDLFRIPMVLVLTAVFIGANFVAAIFLTWMPTFLFEKFHLSLSMAGFSATAYPQVGSILGVICGGALADRLVRRYRGGRMMAQAVGLVAGVPFIFVVGWTLQMPILIPAMAGFGFFKGMYDANIWASLHDVIPVERRSTAVGVVNSIGWFSGGLAAVAIAAASEHYSMSVCISAVSMIYLFFGLLLIWGIAAFMRSKTPVSSININTDSA